MEKVKMTKEEQALLDSLDEFINRWEKLKSTEKPPEIALYRFQAKLFESICSKVEQGMPQGRINPQAKTYCGVPIKCQY